MHLVDAPSFFYFRPSQSLILVLGRSIQKKLKLTELGAPHRETAQAPLCRFGRGLRVKSRALSVCGKIANREETRDAGDVYRFGPLGSVIPYSCVLVDLCMDKLQSINQPPIALGSDLEKTFSPKVLSKKSIPPSSVGKVLLLYLKGIPHAPLPFQTGLFFSS